MNLFEVYPLYDVCPVKAKGLYIYDQNGKAFLDLYGGHGVISVGHANAYYNKCIKEQLDKISFYSNAIQNPLQELLATKLGEASGYKDYSLFLCNSGAEANENALKLASFYTGKSRVIAFNNAFHGRTSAAVSVSDNPKIRAAINNANPVTFLPLNQIDLLINEVAKNDVCAIIIEGIQGVGGLDEATAPFFKQLEHLCKEHNIVLIVDEIQSGYGRTGHFFAHQIHKIKPDIVSVAKGMGNGFPIGGILISPKFKASHGLLGTTFGGNHLACAAGIAVLELLKKDNLIAKVANLSDYFSKRAAKIKQVKKIKGRGLMLGLEFDFEVADLRKDLIYKHQIFTGGSSNKELLRILPPLTLEKNHIDLFFNALNKLL